MCRASNINCHLWFLYIVTSSFVSRQGGLVICYPTLVTNKYISDSRQSLRIGLLRHVGLGKQAFHLLFQFDGLLHMHTHSVVNAEYSQPLTSHTLQDSQSFLTSGQLQILVAKEKLSLLPGICAMVIAKCLHHFIGYVVEHAFI